MKWKSGRSLYLCMERQALYLSICHIPSHTIHLEIASRVKNQHSRSPSYPHTSSVCSPLRDVMSNPSAYVILPMYLSIYRLYTSSLTIHHLSIKLKSAAPSPELSHPSGSICPARMGDHPSTPHHTTPYHTIPHLLTTRGKLMGEVGSCL